VHFVGLFLSVLHILVHQHLEVTAGCVF